MSHYGAKQRRNVDRKRSKSVNSSSLDNDYKDNNGPPVFRHKRFDEPLVKQWAGGLRSDLHENPDAFVVAETVDRQSDKLSRGRLSLKGDRRNVALDRRNFHRQLEADWLNSLRPDIDEKPFDCSFDTADSKSTRAGKVPVKEMIRVKEERKRMEKQITSEWMQSLRPDVSGEEPHVWVPLPDINRSGGNKNARKPRRSIEY